MAGRLQIGRWGQELFLTLCSAFVSHSGGLFSLTALISGLTRRFSTQLEYQQVTR